MIEVVLQSPAMQLAASSYRKNKQVWEDTMPIDQAIGPTVLKNYPATPGVVDADERRRIDKIRATCSSHRTAGSMETPSELPTTLGKNGSDCANVANAGKQAVRTENVSTKIEKTSCTYRGDTFSGDFCVSGTGPDATVSVHRHDAELEGKVGTSTIEAVAVSLLSRIVMREAISTVVKAGEKGHRFSDEQRTSTY